MCAALFAYVIISLRFVTDVVCSLGCVGTCLMEIDLKSMERERFIPAIHTAIKSDELRVM